MFNFLGYQFPAVDDCAPTSNLDMKIDARGSCGNTVYTLTPFQNYPDCNDVGVGVN